MPSAYQLDNLMEVHGKNGVLKAHGNSGVLDVNHNHQAPQRPDTPSSSTPPSSPNPLDNDILKRFTPGLSAFGDYVDLVKRHLMYAVREEVEILKQQIGEMMERIGQLEYENTILRSEAKPETLNKLQQPRVSQTSQTVLPSQNASIMSVPSLQQPQQTTPQPAPQSQASQQAVQPTSQQQAPQTTLFQAGQSPL